MKKSSELQKIDQVIDQTVIDKDRAARLKAVLHQQYDAVKPSKRLETKAYSGFSDELEEFWDNVPV